jgi:hypothetical protein
MTAIDLDLATTQAQVRMFVGPTRHDPVTRTPDRYATGPDDPDGGRVRLVVQWHGSGLRDEITLDDFRWLDSYRLAYMGIDTHCPVPDVWWVYYSHRHGYWLLSLELGDD